MKMNELQALFNNGVLKRFTVVFNPIDPRYWLIQIETNQHALLSLETVRGEEKNYKTVEAALSDVKRITGRLTSLTVNI